MHFGKKMDISTVQRPDTYSQDNPRRPCMAYPTSWLEFQWKFIDDFEIMSLQRDPHSHEELKMICQEEWAKIDAVKTNYFF